MMKVNVLGTEYEIVYKDYKDDSTFANRGCDGYCAEYSKKIVIGNIRTFPEHEEDTEEESKALENEILRHELIHAFLNESGLSYSSLQYSSGWAKNEEMVDFFAIQFPKIAKVFKELKII